MHQRSVTFCLMFVKTIDETYLHKRWNTQQVRRRDVFNCDECGKEFVHGHKLAHSTNGALTFCSKACNKKSRSNGKLAQQWKQTKLARYGVEFSSQVAGASEKMIASRLVTTGASSPSMPTSLSNARFKRTMIERHGAEHPLKARGPKAKRKATVIKRFGKDPLALPENRTNLSEAGQKGYRTTASRVGSWIISKPEMLLLEWLRLRYGHDNIDQQVKIDHGGKKPWLIDAYVKTLDVYVELDGEFWHGLDKPYDQLHPNGKSSYDIDRRKDEWFLSQGKKLVRITDKEFLASHKSNDYSGIVVKLGG